MSSSHNKATVVSKLVNLESNVNKIYRCPLIAVNISKNDISYSNDHNINVEYYVRKIDSPPRAYIDKHYKKIGDNKFYFERPIGAGLIAKMILTVDQNSATIEVNRTYHEVGRVTVDQFYSPGWHIMDIINYLLLQKNHCLIHSAAFEYNGKGILLLGLPNTGKTSTTLNFVLNRNANFISEDIAVTDGNEIFACPYALSPIHPKYTENKLKYKINQKANDLFPLFGHLYQGPLNSITDVVGSNQLENSSEIDFVFVLHNGQKKVEDVTQNKAESLLLSSNRAEFTYSSNQLLWAAEYLGVLNISDIIDNERRIMKRLSETSDIYRIGGEVDFFEESILNIVSDN
jgi:hypothetical protein